MRTVVQPSTTPSGEEFAGTGVLVLYEDGPAGEAALDAGRDLAEQARGSLTVVSAVPQAVSGARCGGPAGELNQAVLEAVAEELEHARVRLGAASGRAEYVLLIQGTDPPLATWCAAHQFDVIVLPARRRL